MTDANDEGITISHGNSLGDLFPGYYPPSDEDRKNAYLQGLVSLDANALLDLYRFSKPARDEFFEVLEKLGPRLFVTHQAALEFHRGRLSTVESRLRAAEEKCKEIEQPLANVVQMIQEFANRYQIDADERQRLIRLVEELSSTLTDAIKAAGTYDLTREDVRRATDVVLTRLNSLLAGRVGDALTEAQYKQAVAEAERRKEGRIPPGYADEKKKKSPDLLAGDFLVWRQLLNEAAFQKRPVLLVSDEQKEDWILKGPSNQVLGPRPELVLEMQREAHVALQMVTVVGLLKEAPGYLGTAVSPSTIREAESLPAQKNVGLRFSSESYKAFEDLAATEQGQFLAALQPVLERLKNDQGIANLEYIHVISSRNGDLYLLRWSADGRAVFRVEYAAAGDFDTIVYISQVNKKKTSDDLANN